MLPDFILEEYTPQIESMITDLIWENETEFCKEFIPEDAEYIDSIDLSPLGIHVMFAVNDQEKDMQTVPFEDFKEWLESNFLDFSMY